MNSNSYFVIYVCPGCGRTYKHTFPSPYNPVVTCSCHPKVTYQMEEVYSSRFKKIKEEER